VAHFVPNLGQADFEFGQSHVCFVQPCLVSNGLRSGDDAGQLLGEKNSGELYSNNFWVRLAFSDDAES
jgi:hypothetical protein